MYASEGTLCLILYFETGFDWIFILDMHSAGEFLSSNVGEKDNGM